MAETTSKLIRLPQELCTLAEEEARRAGLTFTNLVQHALCVVLRQNHADKMIPFIHFSRDLADWLHSTYTEAAFPQDVTKKVFEHIQAEPALLARYRALIQTDGEVDRHFRADVHRQIGKMVKRALNAKVIGRSPSMNRDQHLVESYSLLEPAEAVAK